MDEHSTHPPPAPAVSASWGMERGDGRLRRDAGGRVAIRGDVVPSHIAH